MAPKKLIVKKKWVEGNILEAVADVGRGISIRKAAKRHGMSEGSIRRRLKLSSEGHEFPGSGRKKTLTRDQENDLAKCIDSLCKLGFSPTQSDIKDLFKEFVEINKIKNPFSENRPGKDWLQGFMGRNNISLKQASLISVARKSAMENPFVVYHFYDLLTKVMEEKNFPPENIWNCDESGFPSDPKKVKVVGTKGKPAGAGRENITTLAVASAAGRVLPPLIVFQGKNFQSTWRSEKALPGTWYGCSENGWMTTELFLDWFSQFCDTVKERPLLLLYDGHLTHLSVALLKKAIEEDVTIIKFPPHVTDVLQPLDVACFGPLKREWCSFLEKWTSSFGDREPIKKSTFVSTLGEIWYKGFSESNVISGFKSTGIYPVNCEKYPAHRFDPRLLKRYHTWVELGKPEDFADAMSNSAETPQTAKKPVEQQSVENESLTSRCDQSIESSTTPIETSTPSDSKQVVECDCKVCLKIGPKPPPIVGKIWVPIWGLQEEIEKPKKTDRSFEDLVLDKIKGPKEKVTKKRRKIDLKTKVISDEAEDEAKKNKRSKKKIQFNDEGKGDEKESENDESEEDGSVEIDPLEVYLIQLWKSLSPPNKEEDIVGKWFAAVYETKRKVQMYVGKATNRFLFEENGPLDSLRLDCLKLHLGSGNVLEEIPSHLPRDIGNFSAWDIIAGPLDAEFEKGGKWKFPKYQEVKSKFDVLMKRDRR